MIVLCSIDALGCSVTEIRGSWITDKGETLPVRCGLPDAPFALPGEKEGSTGLADHFESGEKMPAPDTGCDVHPSLVALSSCFQPAIADGRDFLADRLRLNDGGGRNEQERFRAAVVVLQGNVSDAEEAIQQRKGVMIMWSQLSSGPFLLE